MGLQLTEALDMRTLVAHRHLGLGRLHRRTGKRQEAQDRLTPAVTMHREMDMQFWLEQAEVEQDTQEAGMEFDGHPIRTSSRTARQG
jgi:hypothetical protein